MNELEPAARWTWRQGQERLAEYLRDQVGDGIELSFDHIENILMARLPRRARRADWWSTPARKQAQRSKPWHRAGFKAVLLRGQNRVRFDRHAGAAGSWESDGYGRWIHGREGRRRRYTAIDPGGQAFRCTCGKADCPRARLLPFRDHLAELYRVLGAFGYGADILSGGWESVRFALRLAASISDVDADTGYVDDTAMYCSTSIDYENADSEMASKYVAAASIFNFVWIAYEAAVAATAPTELRGLLKDGRLGERGRRLFEEHPELTGRFKGLENLVALALFYCQAGSLFDGRLTRLLARYPGRGFVTAAELSREFRNFVFHGEDEVPAHPEWGSPKETHARLRRFYAVGRLLLYSIQSLAWLSVSPDASVEYGYDEEDDVDPAVPNARHLLESLQFRALS